MTVRREGADDVLLAPLQRLALSLSGDGEDDEDIVQALHERAVGYLDKVCAEAPASSFFAHNTRTPASSQSL